MDYDENDFQSQNFQLVGDENKFPPSLCSFALPKFDFDEHLQVHLRFDGLVDTSILNGVQEPGNNWIEDFSSGTSVVEFSSSVADNCSITRHNNVWSEATSSDSVEMLLKSVGEDEMNNKRAIPMEADAQNVSHMINQLDPASVKADNDNSMMGNVIQDDPPGAPDNLQRNLEQENDAKSFHAQSHGMTRFFNDEVHGSELGASSLSDKIYSGEKASSGQCTEGENVRLQSCETENKNSITGGTLCNMALSDKPLREPDSHGWDACKSARRNPGSACQGTKGQAAEESAVINMTNRSDLLTDNVQDDRTQIFKHVRENEQFLKGHEVDIHLCCKTSTSFLEPTRDSLVLMSDGCSMSGFSGDPDGLLEAIAYPIKALNNDNKAGDKNSTLEREMISQERVTERSVPEEHVNVCNKNIPSQLNDPNGEGIGNESEVNASIMMNMKLQLKETENEIGSEINHCNLGSQASDQAFEGKNARGGVDVKESGSKVVSESIVLVESSSGALFTNTEVKISSSVPGKLHETAEPPDAHASSPETSLAEEHTGPSTSSAVTISNSDDNVQKAESAFSARQSSDSIRATDVPTAKELIHDESGYGAQKCKEAIAAKLPETDFNGSEVNEVKVTGTSSGSVLSSNSDFLLATEPVITTDLAIAESSAHRTTTAQDVSGVRMVYPDETVTNHQLDDASVANVVREQKEETISSQFSPEFPQSDKGEAKMSENSNFAKSEGNVEGSPFAESKPGDDSPLNNLTEAQPTPWIQPSSHVKNSVAFQIEKSHKLVTHEESVVVQKNIGIDDSFAKVKNYSDKLEASCHEDKEATSISSGELHSYDEGKSLLSPLLPGEKASDAPLDSGISVSIASLRSKAESCSLVVEAGKPSSLEPTCGLPTMISCSGHPQEEPQGSSIEHIKYTDLDSKQSSELEDRRNFTFEVGRCDELSGKDAGNQWKPLPSVSSCEASKISKELSKECHQESGGKQHNAKRKVANKDTFNHATGSSIEKPTTRKGRPAKGTSARRKSTDAVGKSCSLSPSGETVSSGMQLEETKPFTESISQKPRGSPVVQPSSLPDLNCSSTIMLHQPFTDPQQVQLRAQIFVYGSLIQSIPPDEACMKSAFGDTDGGRSSWETVWRKSIERYQSQNSPLNSETPLHSHSESGTLLKPDVNTSASISPAKVITPANSTPSQPSPLWSMSTPDGLRSPMPRGVQLDIIQGQSSLHSYPSSQTRQFPKPAWLPQNSRLGPWGVSAQSPAMNATAQYSTIPVVETMQVTLPRDSSMPQAVGSQLVSPGPMLPSPISSSQAAPSVHLEAQKLTASPGSKNQSAAQKSRKRKKAAATEEFAETVPVSQSPMKPSPATTIMKTLPSASPSIPLFSKMTTEFASETLVSTTTHDIPTQYRIIGSGNNEQNVIFGTGNTIEQAKQHAEDAAALAASVVSHSQGIWNQLAAQGNSALATEIEEKFASAAVAAAAAASVAKAAAAAAKVASDAALQAKMMADEALDSSRTGGHSQRTDAVVDAGKNLVKLTPGSILKGKDKIYGSGSIISAAREATRRRVEAACAATKRAENLDAIMKAAELAAEAVSQIGTIIAMGDPLPFALSELVEAGPDASWKAYYTTSQRFKSANKNLPIEGAKDLDHRGDHQDQMVFNHKETEKTVAEDRIVQDNHPTQSGDNCQGSGKELSGSSNLPSDGREMDCHSLDNFRDNVIQKGSVVEVISDEDGLRGGWFSAHVLDVNDNRAHVCYHNLLSENGSGQLKEWIALDSESNGAPRIRIAHPMTAMKYDGRRKRERKVVGNHVWAAGDQVDAWMRDGWWEGVIAERSQLDETKLTVHFPGGGDSSVVRTWDLRPSLIWKDGQWIEWSRARENPHPPYEGDTPPEKRQKMGTFEAKIDTKFDSQGFSKPGRSIHLESSVQEDGPALQHLSAKDKIFSVGKNASKTNISNASKVKRTGLQKEGSGVVFGVPKPGKRRKFMEVSKHYVSDKAETSEGNDSLKFAKYLMPQVSRPWRNTSKVDSRAKRFGDAKALGVKSLKSQASQTGTYTEKDNLSVATTVLNGEKKGHGSTSNMRAGFNNEGNNLEKNAAEVSFHGNFGAADRLVPVSSVQSLSTIHASKKASTAVETGQVVKGKPTALDRSTRNEKNLSEDTGKSQTISDAVEPRRSNRRIQPTSRLLEGLQSSLIISKIPTLLHDKGSKTLHRNSSSRGNTRS